jgi:molecular chaperone DnaJ
MENYYKILEVEENSDQETIKKSYRKLAVKFHPDRNKESGAEEKFKKIAEAYNTLGDKEKRKKYDVERMNKSFYEPFSGFSNARDFGGFSTWGNPSPSKGTSLNITIQLNLQDVLNGVEKKIKIKRNKRCKPCSGTGAEGGKSFQTCGLCKGSGFVSVFQMRGYAQMNSVQSCNSCNGTGRVILENCFICYGRGLSSEEDVVEIKIPPGASDGMQFVVEGKGDESNLGGRNGDLYIKIKEIMDPRFFRKGIDLVSIKEISFVEAVLGTNKEIQLPSGEIVKAVIEPGTIPGTVLKFSQKGIPNMGFGGRGDFLVEVTIRIPKNLSQEERNAVESLISFEKFN